MCDKWLLVRHVCKCHIVLMIFSVFGSVERVCWATKDGKESWGILCERKSTPANAPLIVHVHGGPALPMYEDRSAATNCKRCVCLDMQKLVGLAGAWSAWVGNALQFMFCVCGVSVVLC